MKTDPLSREQLIELVDRIRAVRLHRLPDNDLVQLLESNVPCPDASNLCNSDYPADTVVDICLGWEKTQRQLSREDLLELVRRILSGPAETEAQGVLMVETFIHNCCHPAKSDLIFYPETVFGRRDPTPEEIVDKALGGESPSTMRPPSPLSSESYMDQSRDEIALKQLFDTIESPRFSAEINAGNNLKRFILAVDLRPEVNQLKKAPRGVFERLTEVIQRGFDTSCENPWDVAIATYLWILGSTNQELVTLAAAKVKDCMQCRWARKMAEYWIKFMKVGL